MPAKTLIHGSNFNGMVFYLLLANVLGYMTRVFGTVEDKQFWSDKPIQKGHPKNKVNCYGVMITEIENMMFSKFISNQGIAMNTMNENARKECVLNWLQTEKNI